MLMGISCPSCGGKMYFDINTQQLHCAYCDTQLGIEQYKGKNEGETQQVTYDAVVFTCRNCGAELTAPDEQAVAYCSYCGSEQMLTAKHEQMLRPKKIIPFKKNKKQAMDAYRNAMKGKLYVPKEFKDPKFLEGFRGIYLPYFSYNAVIPGKEAFLNGSAHYTSQGYDYDEEYDVTVQLEGHSQDVNFDASSAFDDTLANEIAPFQSKDMKEFHEGYLAGFYADKATSSGATYVDAAEELAVEGVYKEIEKKTARVKIDREGSLEEQKKNLGISAVDCEVSYFPVWFLTWRNKNRVAYSVMNGQTGKITMDIPVNKKMFFLISLAAAVVLFAILSILPMFILPKTICALAGIILVISSILLHSEIKKIHDRESHIYDYGDTLHTEKKKKMKVKDSGGVQTSKANSGSSKKAGKWVGILIPVVYIAIFFFFSFIDGIESIGKLFSVDGYLPVFVVAIPIQLVFSVLTIMNATRITKKTAIIPAVFAPLVLIAGLVIGIMNSPFDYWYY